MKHIPNKDNCLAIRYVIMTIVTCTAITLSALTAEVKTQRTHFLLLDSRIIEKVENAKLAVGTVQKHKANPLFGEDKTWEKRFDNLYGNVIFDEDENIYKCWYSPFIVDYSAKGMSLEERDSKQYEEPDNREMGICYAISKDGITWEKPNLGLVEYENSKNNNIIWRGPHGAGIFKDAIESDHRRKYKTIFQGLNVSVSPDGLHWDAPTPCQGISVAGDTHNNAFWAPTLKKYVGITRSWGDLGRQVVRIESEDFITWTKEKVVLDGLDKTHQTYAMPVFYYGGIYIGLVAIHEQNSDRVWTELTWSPDTKAWNRVCPGTPLIPYSERKLDYDYGCVYACAYPVFLKDEIRLYYGGSDYLHFGWRTGSLCLATLRPDGFAGYEQETRDKPAVITTSVIPYAGQAIQITADVAMEGWVKVSVLDKDGKRIAMAKTVLKTITDGRLSFSEKIELDEVRLQFELNNAKLYSIRFGK
jgi:hypothetical protein